MAIFNSKKFNRAIFDSEIPNLDKKTIVQLNEEILETIQSISQQIKEVRRFEKQHGTPSDRDWEARARKKIRVCSQFALKIENAGYCHSTYQEAYKFHFDRILADELGPTLEKIEREASALALKTLQENDD